jgi:hypothetical protein
MKVVRQIVYDVCRHYLNDTRSTLDEGEAAKILGWIRSRDLPRLASARDQLGVAKSTPERYRTLMQVEAFFKRTLFSRISQRRRQRPYLPSLKGRGSAPKPMRPSTPVSSDTAFALILTHWSRGCVITSYLFWALTVPSSTSCRDWFVSRLVLPLAVPERMHSLLQKFVRDTVLHRRRFLTWTLCPDILGTELSK